MITRVRVAHDTPFWLAGLLFRYWEHAPNPRLWDDERVLITPHISGGTEVPLHQVVALFCDNLRAYLTGGPLINVIDWQRGY